MSEQRAYKARLPTQEEYIRIYGRGDLAPTNVRGAMKCATTNEDVRAGEETSPLRMSEAQ